MTESLPPEDPRDALIREQAARLAVQDEQIAGHGERIAALEALVAELREQLDVARRAASRIKSVDPLPSINWRISELISIHSKIARRPW